LEDFRIEELDLEFIRPCFLFSVSMPLFSRSSGLKVIMKLLLSL